MSRRLRWIALGLGAFALGAGSGLALLYYTQPSTLIKLSSRMAQFRLGIESGIVQDDVDGFRFHYGRRLGRGAGPPLVFVHGIGGDMDMWSAVVKYLPKDVDVVVYDQPAHGTTDCNPETDCCLNGLSDRLGQFLRLMELDSVHLVGQSLGGAVVTRYASRGAGAGVAAVTLVCPAMQTPEESELVAYLRQTKDETVFVPNTPAEVERTLQYCLNRPSRISHHILSGVIEMKKKNRENIRKLAWSLADEIILTESDEYHLTNSARRITAPSHIIWGNKDRMVHVSGAESLKASLRDCRQVDILDGCGHSVNMLRPATFAHCLMEFRGKVLGDQPKPSSQGVASDQARPSLGVGSDQAK